MTKIPSNKTLIHLIDRTIFQIDLAFNIGSIDHHVFFTNIQLLKNYRELLERGEQ